MNRIKITLIASIMATGIACSSSNSQVKTETSNALILKEAFQDRFYIGAALNLDQIWERDQDAITLVEQQFNSIVAENCMKSMYLQPREGEFNFKDADRFVAFGQKNNMQLIGHTLIWHSQVPKWFFVDENGQDVSRDVLIERMRTHIHTVVSRYKGKITGWDVVNEAVLDNGEYRKSKFYEIIGEDFIPLAFRFTHEADPDAELYYNDYSTALPAKREGIIKVAKSILKAGLPLHGLGMQEHQGLHHPDIDEVEKTILAFSETGASVMVTELDISVLPHARENMGAEVSETYAYSKQLNPYPDGLPDSIMEKLGDRYISFFKLYLKHSDKISRVTVWGVGDHDSWKNGWPIPGRTDYPLLFDRQFKPKPFVQEIVRLARG
ncbi:endo-1,4-beta-xylanase [Sphingobacterium sp. lm-10]|uniref:endo-1,4-beta-xylanase n=1 Tax=Sphingobacterium sp. lm-10 TaxID=2944904 RepID=UPI00201FCDD4|nr:endo-1,4-beta-xylanase [Sphingobacterium sp. lm-10]MCL7986683.1 endo-1,4-beta-xylanase [Sphingobacterium sp. lm-10]